jgi:hypothetical protein
VTPAGKAPGPVVEALLTVVLAAVPLGMAALLALSEWAG